MLSTYYLRLERAGGVLTWSRSADGMAWAVFFTKDFGSAFDGLDQRVTIAGASWHVPAGSYADWDYITLAPTIIPIDIDIKPGSYPNSINPKSKGVIPVAVLTTGSFNATTVDPATVRFGPGAATEAHGTGHVEDVDGDGDDDLMLHFRMQATGIQCGDTSATLTGQTFGGQSVEGVDSVRTVGCS